MEDRRLSPYVFRPILEPSEESPGHQASNQTSGGARSRVCSGDLWPSQCIASPTGALRGSVAVNPKLLTCYKLSQETWSSAGSRHSSRPGSSLASSRPSSQCASLYCRSNNSSLSDVSVARNFQQLTVSNRRQAYKTQKWSHSHEPNGGNGQPAGGSIGSAQSSPGRRRQASLQQKSLDLDSGYLGSSVGDLKSWASHSQSSWNEQVGANRGSNTTTSGIGHLDFQSPIGEIKQEDFTEDDFSARCASLPSFHESFQPGSQMNRDARCLNLMDSGLTGLNLPPEESFDDLDEEIKLIVARGNQDNTIQRFCDEADEVIPEKRDRLIEPEKFIRPEPVSLCISREGSRNPLLSHSGGVVSIVTDTSKSVEPGSSGLPPRPRRLIRSRRIYEEQELLPKDDPPNQGKSLASGWCDNESNYKMHFEDQQQLISSFRVPHHHFLGSDGNLSPDTIGCSPHLPNCTPVNSPPATVGSPGGHLSGHPSSNPDGRIFQFPPPEQLQRNCRDDWGLDQQQGFGEAGSLSNAAAASSPMAVSPSDLSTLNTPRSSLASAHSRNSPMNTDHVIAPSNQNQEAGIDDLYLTYLDEEIGFCPEAIGGGNTNPYLLTSFNLDAVPISGFPSPPGSGYSSPAPGYMDSVNDLPSVISVASYDTESKHDPDPEYVLSPYVPLHRRSELHATSSTPDPESFLSSDTCPETPDGSVKEEVDSPDTGAYVCLWDYCNEEFETQKSFVDHLNEAHTETKKGCDEFPCLWKDCSRKLKPFNAKYKLITHMRVHTKEKPYRCTYENCNRAFARSENRKIHVRSHTGQKPFSCKFSIEFNCSKKFSNSSDRAKHEQTHKDPKPYKCEVLGCTKRYTDPSSLRKHVKGHTQEEQMQYRKAKDLANQAKRSVSPTTRYWMIESSDRHISEYPSQLASSTSLVLPALQSGGTLYTIDSGDGYDQSRSLEGRKVEQKQETSHKQSSEGHLQSLVHQPDSLDDLDNDTIPFDNIPVRYDSPELYELQASWNEDGNQGSSSSMMQM